MVLSISLAVLFWFSSTFAVMLIGFVWGYGFCDNKHHKIEVARIKLMNDRKES